ncbi:MAG: rod shape-determining protein MreC [Oscillospiraceae bacterium]
MKKLLEHKIILFLIIATIVGAIFIGVFSVQRKKTTIVENGVNITVSPIQKGITNIGNWFYGIGHYFGDVNALKTENEELKNKNSSLEKQISDIESMKSENERLTDMLDLKGSDTKFELEAARIIAKNPSNWYSTFTIDKGTSNGLKVNQPIVTTQEQLVGKIYRIGSTWAEVITILDPGNSAGSTIRRSKDIGIVEGDTELRYSGKCKIDYLPRDTDIKSGDYVETSGLGGIYPKGIVIGKISDVGEDSSTMSKFATVEPMAEINKLTEVFVIKNNFELVGEEGK